MENIYKNSDEVIQVIITDGTDPINPNDTSDIIISVYQQLEVIIQQWKLSDGTVSIFDAANGKVRVNLDRANTANLPEKRLYIEVAVEFANVDFEGGIQVEFGRDADDNTIPYIVLADLKNTVL